MDKFFDDFLSDFDTALSDLEAFDVLCKHTKRIGFDKIIYLYDPDECFNSERAVEMTTYDPKWMSYWKAQGYAEIDIGVQKTISQGYKPLIFNSSSHLENPEETDSSESLHALWEAKEEGGCEFIYSHQLFQNQLGKGAMGFVSSIMDVKDFVNMTEKKCTVAVFDDTYCTCEIIDRYDSKIPS